ncbi:MAG TPA: glycosyltransferase [Campylobacterales bacterium]|nr:glycosyltransferase [Campylobacterales bacterium]
MNNKKSILFLSANDFKEKSIQVIRKTPEAYVKDGWDVTYIVARDKSKSGNYFYEKEINPDGVNVIRFYSLFSKLKDKILNQTLRTIVSKVSGYITILLLTIKAFRILRKKDIDVIYGYEMHGVLSSRLVRLFSIKNYIYVNRFMGTWLTQYYDKKQYQKLIFNFDQILALKSKSDLCIMTDDGTLGDRALEIFNSKSLSNYRFWSNGVDEQKIPQSDIDKFKEELYLKDEKIFVSVSRLESWKRVDRAIEIISKVKDKNIKYFIIGDGYLKEDLEKRVKELKIEDKIIFVGAIDNKDVKKYLSIADYFLSLYDLSNVGNPLLEAIRANKIIFTLHNGDTSRWIQHKKNGFIYEINNDLYKSMASDIDKVIADNELATKIIQNIKKTEIEKLWTWEERMSFEVQEVEKLLKDNIK